ncbi:neutral alpha-glucosidase AB-like isoform X2 [Apostichopus japonicus]|uniref:neutral alpha-glucosidase AB-like isoform X2 n=1 Tax=Stichopus japonicus TaxID=307972 RepID=UPI003AB23BF2
MSLDNSKMAAHIRNHGVMFSRGLHLLVAVLVILSGMARAVDKSNFKKCDQSGFCKRNRRIQPGSSPYAADLDSARLENGVLHLNVLNTQTGILLKLELYALQNQMVRMKINEVSPLKPRYEVPDVLVAEPEVASWQLGEKSESVLEGSHGNAMSFVLTAQPFRLDILYDGQLVTRVNSRGLMNFEHLRTKKNVDPPQDENEEEKKEEEGEEQEEEVADDSEIEDEKADGMWEETFKTHHDSKPNGPSAVAMDFTFPGYEHLYGIPEHADTLALKTTKSDEPYRLYNLDVFEYDLDSRMALYGSVPLMLAHNSDRTVGLFWLNAAETWIDITSNTADKSMFGRMMDYVKGDQEVPEMNTHWISESGIIDVFFLMGPKPYDIFSQYASLTGLPYMPPMFALGYHQCRWNYNDEEDVKTVDEKFDEHDIPYDVIWLDIEHTNGKRYMTWDKHKFPNPIEMQNNIASKGRKMVTIVDPHIKQDNGYHLYKEAKDQDYFIRNKDNNEFQGWCWPGSSSYPDFTREDVRAWWASKMSPELYEGSTHNLFTWNDMNEPSVFNGPEVTMHKDAKHAGGWEHRDVHNIYGFYVHRATAEGQIARTDGRERPFVLSRAFFAGSQRYGAIWTGDNAAEWSHLKASLPMCLSISIAGIPFIGADVGGFFKNPDTELLTRWYQAGAYQPFFRAHAHLDTKRREPWLYPEENTAVIRTAIRNRYALLPYWYTLFYQASQTGVPPMRPMWVEFPEDSKTFAMEDQYMIGSSLLVRPITDAGATSVSVYLPGQNTTSMVRHTVVKEETRWYRMDTFDKMTGPTQVSLSVSLTTVPVFQRGGSILPTKERVRRCSSLGAGDPYTLKIALDAQGSAVGQLYTDDGHTYNFQKGQYIYRQFEFKDNKLISKNLAPVSEYNSKSWLERVVIIGLSESPNHVSLISQGGNTQSLEFGYSVQRVLSIRKPAINIAEDFEISLT